MLDAQEILLQAINENRPMVLVLGQKSYADGGNGPTLLSNAVTKLGLDSSSDMGWLSLLDAGIPEEYYDWLAERFRRHVPPPSVEVLSEVPWCAIFTSSLDPALSDLFTDNGREAEPILTSSEYPRSARSRARPPFYYLFSRAGEHDPRALPPSNRLEWNARRMQHTYPLLNRILDTATPLGMIAIDGFVSGDDWLSTTDLVSSLVDATENQVLWFGGYPRLDRDEAALFDELVETGRILVEQMRLGSTVAALQASGRLSAEMQTPSEEAGVVSFGNNRELDTTPEERLRVEAVASIVDDSWTPTFLDPLGPDAEYDAFRRFHGDRGGPRLMVEGIQRNFAIARDFEQDLLDRVREALAEHWKLDTSLVVSGQSGTGKSVALARIVATVRAERIAPALYGVGRIPQLEEISSFCESAENAGALATLVVCDANRDVDDYDELLGGLRSRGRKVVVVGSQYRSADHNLPQSDLLIEAPANLSERETHSLNQLLETYLGDIIDPGPTNHHFLAYMYRCLPASRPRIGAGLSAEARAAEEHLREWGKQSKPVMPVSQLHQQLIENGYIAEYQPIFDERHVEALESEDSSAGKFIDFVMTAGRLHCPVPVNLLLRAVSGQDRHIDASLIANMFTALDLFRWDSSNSLGDELLISPRITLEARLICNRRLGSPLAEAERLNQLIGFVRQGIDNVEERRFLLDLLQQVGRDGPEGLRYKQSFVSFARTLTELRQRFNVLDASLMLQESAFRRSAVREREVDDADRFELLEEARDAVQTALDGIANGNIQASRQTRQNLLVERAALYGFLTYDRVSRSESGGAVWSAYQAAKTAVTQAVSATDNYYPHDVALWTPADIFQAEQLTDQQRAELAADIYSALHQVERAALSETQRERFDQRRMYVGETLEDHELTEDAYVKLEAEGSTAGYFLRARSFAPRLNYENVGKLSLSDMNKAGKAADFLMSRWHKIFQDERCLFLLLECKWIAALGSRPFHGERQPLPTSERAVPVLRLVQALNQCAGASAQYRTRYLEGVLSWLTEDYLAARDIFRQIARETDNVYRRRVNKRHVVSNDDQTFKAFKGRVEQKRGENRWSIRVDGLNQLIDLIDTDFPHDDIAIGRTLSDFTIAFSFIGPIADRRQPRTV